MIRSRLIVSLVCTLASLAGAQSPAQRRSVLLDPARPTWSARAPATVTADVETSRGTFTLELIREWAPRGVDRFYNLARAGYYDDSRFYRVIAGFIAQFGIAGDPAVARAWSQRRLPADPVREHNVRGTISFAQYKPTDRTTNVFINLRDNPELDTLKFVPIGRVVQGMEVVDSLYAYYGEFPSAEAPLGNPQRLARESNKYLDEKFPSLDRVVRITIRPDSTRGLNRTP
jgi:cyclophilin family peptidyl-prolyl cis-trans isomerase